ncbi:MAG: hypothetical protein V4696_03565 [Pseudomonadota bacterium]
MPGYDYGYEDEIEGPAPKGCYVTIGLLVLCAIVGVIFLVATR